MINPNDLPALSTSSSGPPPNASPTVPVSVTLGQSVQEELDFKPFLEAVNKSAAYSRFVTYTLLVALIATFAYHRSVRLPAWMGKRVSTYLDMYVCYQKSWDTPFCADLKKTMRTLTIKLPDKYDPDNEYGIAFKKQLEEFVSARAKALSVTIPLAGITFDANDMGLVSGFALFSILMIFSSCQRREKINLTRARKISRTENDLMLIEATQMLSAPYQEKVMPRLFLLFAFSLPSVMQYIIVYAD